MGSAGGGIAETVAIDEVVSYQLSVVESAAWTRRLLRLSLLRIEKRPVTVVAGRFSGINNLKLNKHFSISNLKSLIPNP